MSRGFKWAFGSGDLVSSAPLAVVAFFQLFFLTDVARISPGLAVLPVALGKLWDAINDPLVGFWADRVRSRIGRRRVLLLAGALPMALSFVLMWLVPDLGITAKLIYYGVVFIIFDSSITVIQVAHHSMTAELSSDYDEQSSINGVKMVYSIGGSLVAIIVGTVLQWFIPDLARVFMLLGIVTSVIILIPTLVVFRVTRGRDKEVGEAMPPMWKGIREILGNRPFWMVMGIYLASWTAVSMIAAVLVYYATYNLQAPDEASYFVLVAQSLAIAFIPLAVGIARKWDKRTAVIVGFGTMIPVLLVIGMVPVSSYRVVYFLAALLGLGIATAYVTPWSMIPDVIAWDQWRGGVRREGSYYAMVSFFQKAGTAGALWIMGTALEMRGYITPTDAVPVPIQPESALGAIRILITVVPSALLLISVIIAGTYPINRQVHAEMLQDIEGLEGAEA